jgi:chromosomal replication initiator protein
MNDLKEKWSAVLEKLRPELSGISFETWLLPLEPLKVDEVKSHVFLEPPSEMHHSTLERRYMSVLESAIKDVFGTKYTAVLQSSEVSPRESLYDSDIEEKFSDEYYFNPRYNFNSFVVGSNNKYAHAAAVAVAEAPSEAYNPLFIYGGSGLGKTHLMHAIGHFILKNSPLLKVLYVSSEMFTNEFINALSKRKMPEFKNKYRNIDVLLIDDIQFIEGKDGIQEEFFFTFNTLYELNKQIIISSDRAPNQLLKVDERLRSRFQWNIITDISAPDFETRVAILRKKAELENLDITPEFEEVIQLIAEKIKLNIRELEGAFMRVISFSSLMDEKIDLKFARAILKDVLSSSDLQITSENIKKAVCNHFNIKVLDIESSKRTKDLAYPRQIAMYLCRELTEDSLSTIGETFGKRDHTTVLHGYQKIDIEIKNNDSLKDIIDTLKKELNFN